MLIKKTLIAMMLVLLLAAGNLQAGGDASKGAELAVNCADCHGDDGKGDDDIPAIAGLDAADIAKALADFKSGAVESSEMQMFAEDLSEQDMADLAAYYAKLAK
jgi:cytochrome c553